MAKMTFDEALKLNNIRPPDNNDLGGLTPLNYLTWLSLLTDVSKNLYKWNSDLLSFYDLLLIEDYIWHRKSFVIVRTRNVLNRAVQIRGNYIVSGFTSLKENFRNQPIKIRLNGDNFPKNMLLEYNIEDFIVFNNFAQSMPSILTKKYAEILAKLDALYEQNIDKLGMPIIGVVQKGLKNELLNIFKRTKMNALFSLVNNQPNKGNANELFFNPKIDFILDKVNAERESIMKEFLQELGVNPNNEVMESTHYVNTKAIKESSLISKYFSATTNLFRDNFVDECREKFPEIGLSYETVVKTYDENTVEQKPINGENEYDEF